MNFCYAEEEAFNQNDEMLCKVSLFPKEEFQEKKMFSSLVCIGKKAVLLVLTVAFSLGHYSRPQAQFLPRRISYLVNYMLTYVLKISLYYMCSTLCWVEITADNKGRKAKLLLLQMGANLQQTAFNYNNETVESITYRGNEY